MQHTTTTEAFAHAYMGDDDIDEQESLVENGPEEDEDDDDDQGILASLFGQADTMPATVAQQVFSVVPGIAGGIAGFVLAGKLANSKRVKTKGVLMASMANALLTFATIFLIVAEDDDDD